MRASGAFLLLPLWGCPTNVADLAVPSRNLEQAQATPAQDNADNPQEKLYQLLYQSELGESTHPLGQRVRILSWLTILELNASELSFLRQKATYIQELTKIDHTKVETSINQEELLLGPEYERLIVAFSVATPPSNEMLMSAGQHIKETRKEISSRANLRKYQKARFQKLMDVVRPWISSLSSYQREQLGHHRFFLSRRLGPYTAPRDYGDFVGFAWDGGDFTGLRSTIRLEGEREMNIGGLWTTERLRSPPMGYLTDIQLSAITVMAMQEEQFIPAIEIKLGEREPLDFSQSPNALAQTNTSQEPSGE